MILVWEGEDLECQPVFPGLATGTRLVEGVRSETLISWIGLLEVTCIRRNG